VWTPSVIVNGGVPQEATDLGYVEAEVDDQVVGEGLAQIV
jgi:hypothetical protein